MRVSHPHADHSASWRTVSHPHSNHCASRRTHDLRHTCASLSTRSGATLKDTMVRAGQSSEKAALIYQHSDEERQEEVAAGLDDATVQKAREEAARKATEERSGTDLARGE